MKTTRNSDKLASFVAYCNANPEQRFWQALRNWSGYDFIFRGNVLEMGEKSAEMGSNDPLLEVQKFGVYDTFYQE